MRGIAWGMGMFLIEDTPKRLSTPFPIWVVSALKAMRLYTDGKCALMAQTMDIEIGGALTDDTPPELSAEAS